MPSISFTTLESTVASALDFHIKSDAFAQTIQEKPLINALTRRQKSFPGGKGDITMPVVFNYTTSIDGYEGDDEVTYANPQNTKRVKYPWYEIHAGITMTFTELKQDGITVTDSVTGESTSRKSGREATVLTNILKAKLDDMTEGWARDFNKMLWLDGSQDAKQVPGIMSFIKPAATNNTGTVGGIARNLTVDGKKVWQNRADTFTYEAGATNIIDGLRREIRQLKRYGGKPSVIFCGSGFLERLEKEISSKGIFTQSGFSQGTDISIGVPRILGIGEFVYDPTLDDLPKHDGTGNQTNHAYILDVDGLGLYTMEGEDKKVHNPARPENKYVLYKGMTWTGAMTCKRLSGSGLYVVEDAEVSP
jgi:hypothetical protein